jgi:glycosyltransferase involved in cell wall biosynthesis
MNENRKKALFFVQESVGGAERITVLIAKMLDLEKYDVKFVCVPYSQVSNSILDFLPPEYGFINIGMARPFVKMLRMFKVLWCERPDIVFTSVLHLTNKILPFRFLFPCTKFIVRCENYLFTFSKKQRLEVLLLYRLASRIIAQTDEMKVELVERAKIPEKKIIVLENPIDCKTIEMKLQDSQNPYPQNGKRHFVASGRFCYQKGFDLLVKAFATLKKCRDDVDLYVIGANDGEYREEYGRVESLSKELGVAEDFHCVGYQSNPYKYVKYADCFVLSSRWEGLPNVLIESLYLGTPVAAFKCIPIVERIVSEQKNGFLADAGDEKSLAQAMENALQLNRVEFFYKGASKEQFISLF